MKKLFKAPFSPSPLPLLDEIETVLKIEISIFLYRNCVTAAAFTRIIIYSILQLNKFSSVKFYIKQKDNFLIFFCTNQLIHYVRFIILIYFILFFFSVSGKTSSHLTKYLVMSKYILYGVGMIFTFFPQFLYFQIGQLKKILVLTV